MRILFIYLFIVNIVYSQEQTFPKKKITLGASLQYGVYQYKEFESNGSTNGGKYIKTIGNAYSFNFHSSYQNNFLNSSVELGVLSSPIDPDFLGQIYLKGAFNILYKDKSLKNFIGPSVGLGYYIPSPKYSSYEFENKLTGTFGVLFIRNRFQVEISKLLRKNRQYNYSDIFIQGYYINIGFRIPLKKEPKN